MIECGEEKLEVAFLSIARIAVYIGVVIAEYMTVNENHVFWDIAFSRQLHDGEIGEFD